MSNGTVTPIVTPDEFYKDPGSKLDYEMDWSDWLAENDSISASVFNLPANNSDPNDIKSSGATHGPDWVKCWFENGLPGKTYFITNQITTTLGRIVQRSIIIICKDM